MLAKRNRRPAMAPARRPGLRPHPRRATDHGPRTTDKRRRRGVTLIEMLVTVAVLVIMMTIIVQIFQAATGSVSVAQKLQGIDDQLRRIDGILRADLDGTTARFTPPGDPLQNRGYFEYGENEFADNQGEDSDDYIRFTTKAPAGRPFTGRMWVQYFGQIALNANNGYVNQPEPITITSDYAEIIYFVRNGNLYRRVFLIVPELQSAIAQAVNNVDAGGKHGYYPTIFGGSPVNATGTQVSWLGVNDLSARPAATGNASYAIQLNTLGDLTQRENRAFLPRSGTDFLTATSNGYNAGQDGIPDDVNGDNNPDLYPSLYPGVLNPSNLAGQLVFAPPLTGQTTGVQVIASNPGVTSLAFPYVFPGAYSKAQALTSDQYGWIHSPTPVANSGGQLVQFDTGGLSYLNAMNHNPLDVGDNLPTPINPAITSGTEASMLQTWWGFPTWRETLSPAWNDPTVTVFDRQNTLGQPQPNGLNYAAMNVSGGALVPANPNLLPPMADPSNFTGNFSIIRQVQQPFSDAAGQSSAFWTGNNNVMVWSQSWEDDLIMTNVRSFDVKAYDYAMGNYADLGWGDDLRLYTPYQNAAGFVGFTTPPAIASTPGTLAWPPINSYYTPTYPTLSTLAHEGRMPPLQHDHRLDWQNPNPYYYGATNNDPTNFTPQYSNFPHYSSNVGDDNAGIVRLRRVWDSWSIEYSRAPSTGVGSTTGGFPVGPVSFSPPIYPSYPAPYPAPLRGIQIQIRVADPTNQQIKSLTIRQDFTDKL